MANNRIFANGRKLTLTVSTADAAASSDFASGKPVRAGQLLGVALTDMSSNVVTIDTQGVYALSVFRPSTVGDGRVGSMVYYNTTAFATTASSLVALPSGTTVVPSTGSQPFGIIIDAMAPGTNSSANTTGVRVKLIGIGKGISAAAAT